MTGVSGTGRNGTVHQYYQCVTNRRRGDCKKKTVQKSYIEDKVINETIRILTPENIDRIARSVEALCEKERNTANLKRINKLIKENETATENLVKSLEAGRVVDVIYAQIEKRQQEKADLETQLAKEKIQTPLLKYEQIRFFFERFIKGDVNDINYRRALVDIFISRIYLYDNKITIFYNAHEGQINVPIDELKINSGSPMGHLVEAAGIEPASEDCHLKLSTSVDCVLISPVHTPTSQAYDGVASFIQIKPQSLSLIRSLLMLHPKRSRSTLPPGWQRLRCC